VFTDVVPGEDLVATLALACRVAKIAACSPGTGPCRLRAMRARRPRTTGVPAPLETLASLLNDSYLGGA
jgi:hypothetical protein